MSTPFGKKVFWSSNSRFHRLLAFSASGLVQDKFLIDLFGWCLMAYGIFIGVAVARGSKDRFCVNI
jgi:hypothetical protein